MHVVMFMWIGVFGVCSFRGAISISQTKTTICKRAKAVKNFVSTTNDSSSVRSVSYYNHTLLFDFNFTPPVKVKKRVF